MMKKNIIALIEIIIITVLAFVLFAKYSVKNEEIPIEASSNEVTEVYPTEGKIIVIDPGHGLNNVSDYEKVSPKDDRTKPAFVSGTTGRNQTEEQLNLSVALLVRDKLTRLGARVYMTREGHESDKSNIGRAEFANNLNADISVKIHADGSEDKNMHGVSVLVPTEGCLDDSLFNVSERLGNLLLDETVKASGAKNNGISYRDDMTGFNWSSVPVALVEMGFMTNPDEDAMLETAEYQNKIAEGIVNGITAYFTE